MIYIFPENSNGACSIHYAPELLSESQKAKGIALEKLPEPEKVEGKYAELYADLKAGKIWYEYKDIPQETNLDEIEQRLDKIEQRLNNIEKIIIKNDI